MKCNLVMVDWRKQGKTIEDTPEGFDLSLGDLHGGATFEAMIELPDSAKIDIEEGWVRLVGFNRKEENGNNI